MDEWFVTVLISIRDMAKKSGMITLAERWTLPFSSLQWVRRAANEV